MTVSAAFPEISAEQLLAELRRERGQRARFYPDRVKKGRLLQADADRELAIAGAWVEDVERRVDLFARLAKAWQQQPAGAAWQNTSVAEARHAIPWAERRGALLRELELRDRVYPDWIRSGRMSEAQAAHQVTCLKALLEIYEGGWDWHSTAGELPAFAAAEPTREQRQARQEWHALRAEIDDRDGRSQQQLAFG